MKGMIYKLPIKHKEETPTQALTKDIQNNLSVIKDDIVASSKENVINGEELDDFIYHHFLNRLDPVEYCENVLRHHLPESRQKLHENQTALIRAVCNPKLKQVAGMMSRQSGKTESISSFCGFLIDNYPQMRVGVFTPRLQQAEVSIGRLSTFFQMNEDRLNNKIVKLTKDRIELSNKSYVTAVSASDQSNIEGLTFDVIVLDEAQKVSDYTFSERIVPMGN